MSELTQSDIAKFIADRGLSVSDVVLGIILEKLESIQDCLSKHYSDADRKLITLYAATLLAEAQGGRKISSQIAPSGASQSYAYNDDSSKQLLESLQALDVMGCTGSLGIVVSAVGFFDVVG